MTPSEDTLKKLKDIVISFDLIDTVTRRSYFCLKLGLAVGIERALQVFRRRRTVHWGL